MGTVNLNVRTDESIKRAADEIFSSLGMNTTTAINIYLAKVVQYGGIPFELRLDHPNAETRATIDAVNHGRDLSRSFHSVEELMEDLNA